MNHDHVQHAAPGAAGGTTFWNWFTGGSEHPYMNLIHCMSGDTLWITLTIALDLAVACGYVLIALHWQKNQKTLPHGPAREALGQLRNIFIFCGLCGYVFIPVKMVWPAWRLYDVAMAFLLYYTWRYALNARGLKVIYQELNQSQKLKADLEQSREESKRKSFFLNAISHDLRTPLNSLMLQADLAQMTADSRDPEGLREALKEIKAGAAATAHLLNGFLELGKLDWLQDPNKVETVDVGQLLLSIASAHNAAAEQKGLWLRVKTGEGAGTIRTDRTKLVRILTNFVSNAIKFTDAGGVTLTSERANDQIAFLVADTGVGIAPEHQASLFQEFFQVENRERDRRKGFGLGLAIARRLALHLNGDIQLRSEPGRGSEFRLLLPAVVASDDADAGRNDGISARDVSAERPGQAQVAAR